jgi:hypothetical protein
MVVALDVVLLHRLQGVDTMLVTSGCYRLTGNMAMGGGERVRWAWTFKYGFVIKLMIGCLFSILLLCINIECAYYVAITLICLNVFWICDVGSLSFVSSSFIEGM